MTFSQPLAAVRDGKNILILSDRGVDKDHMAIPALLASAGLHNDLIREKVRPDVGIILESGEPREIHHFAALIGFGVTAINPYLALETVKDLADKNRLHGKSAKEALANYLTAAVNGILGVMSKMGISTVKSYHGAQIFEAVGIGKEVAEKYFGGITSPIGGIGLKEIAKEAEMRHEAAYEGTKGLSSGDVYMYHRNGDEPHILTPEAIRLLQRACRTGSYEVYKEFAKVVNEPLIRLRDLLEFNYPAGCSIPIEEVESVDSIVHHFRTGAMSYGALSKEAHECIAKAMNALGSRSNTGEGGEDTERFAPLPDGSSVNDEIKQVSTARFGVTGNYLVHGKEIQIKCAQGAKPGEGGHLPGSKVDPAIGKTRHSTPGVALISPPPHHDVYSIEDLAELIYDLKNANKYADISVKLVSEAGVGTVAAGVAKAGAQVILISGYDGGTGAAPRSSIHNAGLPWELGLAETHQTLIKNGLRNRVMIETDGKLMSGRDVVIAALLGAEEFGFATAPLVTMGCVMMRVCNLDTCPMGIATQNPELRKRFRGKPEYVINFMRFIAEEMREYMAKLGFRTVDEMVGRSDLLKRNDKVTNEHADRVDLSQILNNPFAKAGEKVTFDPKDVYDFKLGATLDEKVLLKKFGPAMDKKEKKNVKVEITNTDRTVGTILGAEITRKFGTSLEPDTYTVQCKGAGGQSFGAFIPKGLTLELEGDSNDYFGKGLSGGKLVVYPPKARKYKPEENIIVGNVALYGATSGEAYINGIAGERFCVRNSGAYAVVEGVGEHGCEYMTGGRVVVLGATGKNFAAGMSGGIAYVLDEKSNLYRNLNKEMISIELVESKYDIAELKNMIEKHVAHTGSEKGKEILTHFDEYLPKFKKIIPNDYKRMMMLSAQMEDKGLSSEQAQIEAFYESMRK